MADSASALDLLSRKFKSLPITILSALLVSVNTTTYPVTQQHPCCIMVYPEPRPPAATQLVCPEALSSNGHITELYWNPVLQWPHNSQECSDSGGYSYSTRANLQYGGGGGRQSDVPAETVQHFITSPHPTVLKINWGELNGACYLKVGTGRKVTRQRSDKEGNTSNKSLNVGSTFQPKPQVLHTVNLKDILPQMPVNLVSFSEERRHFSNLA